MVPEHATAEPTFLAGQVLIAMPGLQDPRFQKSLVYLCAHSAEGAMGLIVNKRADGLTLKDLFGRIGIPVGRSMGARAVHYGGPVETARGFVLHTGDYQAGEATLTVDERVGMTATVEVLHAMAMGKGPELSIVALGYAGWGAGQLESELRRNDWLACAADDALLFGAENDTKWDRALAKIGVSPGMLSALGGRA